MNNVIRLQRLSAFANADTKDFSAALRNDRLRWTLIFFRDRI